MAHVWGRYTVTKNIFLVLPLPLLRRFEKLGENFRKTKNLGLKVIGF